MKSECLGRIKSKLSHKEESTLEVVSALLDVAVGREWHWLALMVILGGGGSVATGCGSRQSVVLVGMPLIAGDHCLWVMALVGTVS